MAGDDNTTNGASSDEVKLVFVKKGRQLAHPDEPGTAFVNTTLQESAGDDD